MPKRVADSTRGFTRSLDLRAVVLAALSCMAVFSPGLSPAGDTAPGDNIARGRPYTLSAAPSDTWHGTMRAAGLPLPDLSTVLTDGDFAKGAYFWTSSQALNFVQVAHIDVVVDLGAVKAIAGISVRHGADPSVGIRLPRLDEFFVSEDGVRFAKVAEQANSEPSDMSNPSALFRGVKTIASGPLATRGRFVAVRTHTYPDGRLQTRYVGHDEVVVTQGRFDPATRALDAASLAPLTPEPTAANLRDYAFTPVDWVKRLKRMPLFIGLTPHHFVGDETYHLSVGGTYVLGFELMNRARGPIRKLQFRLELPADVVVHDWNKYAARATRKSSLVRDGRPYTVYVIEMADDPVGPFYWPFFVVSSGSSEPTDELGSAYYRYEYRAGGARHDSGEQRFSIALDPAIAAPAPRDFVTGFWVPYASRLFQHPAATLERLFGFYQKLGFNTANGGQNSAAIHAALTRLGLDDFTGTGLATNALQFAVWQKEIQARIAPGDRFERHPRSSASTEGICPEKFVSERFDALRMESAQKILATTRHVYENWEPYTFQKHGCICDTCRAAFSSFTGKSKAEVDALWPDVVLDKSSTEHNAFSSHQYGRVVQKLQETVRAAGAAKGLTHRPDLIPAIAYVFFDPASRHHAVHDPAAYLGHLSQLIVWAYPNMINKSAESDDLRVGNNLAILPAWDHVLLSRRDHGRLEGGRRLPRVHYLSSEAFDERLALPADYYFISVLAFVHGLDGYGSWTVFFKQDARFLRAHARANALIQRFEDVVLLGRRTDDHALKSSSPAPFSDGVERQVLHAQGFEHLRKGSERPVRVFALGNDHHETVQARFSIQGLASGAYELVDELAGIPHRNLDGTAYSSADLASGVALSLGPKTWSMLELAPVEAVQVGGSCWWRAAEVE